MGETTHGITYRESEGEGLRIRQGEPWNDLIWETAPAPAQARTTFVFAGGTAFIDPNKAGQGFGLSVNGRMVLTFDTTREPASWTSPDGEIVLRYVPALSQSSWDETMGLFYLSLPAKELSRGKAVTLGLRPIGGEYRHWFALNPYTDILDGAVMPAGR